MKKAFFMAALCGVLYAPIAHAQGDENKKASEGAFGLETTPIRPEAVEPGAAKLFARATRVYGESKSLAFNYRVTFAQRDGKIQESQRGRILWMRPNMFAETFKENGMGSHVVTDGKQLFFTKFDTGKQARTPFGPGKTVLGMMEQNPPMYYFTSFLAGKNPLQHDIDDALATAVKTLPTETIEGTVCDGLVIELKAPNILYSDLESGSIRMWFDRSTGLVRRQNWRGKQLGSDYSSSTTTDYTATKLNPALKRSDFFLPGEEKAPLLKDADMG